MSIFKCKKQIAEKNMNKQICELQLYDILKKNDRIKDHTYNCIKGLYLPKKVLSFYDICKLYICIYIYILYIYVNIYQYICKQRTLKILSKKKTKKKKNKTKNKLTTFYSIGPWV